MNVQPAAELSPKTGEAAEGAPILRAGGGEHAGQTAVHEPRSAHVQVSSQGVNDSLQVRVSPIVQQRADALAELLVVGEKVVGGALPVNLRQPLLQ